MSSNTREPAPVTARLEVPPFDMAPLNPKACPDCTLIVDKPFRLIKLAKVTLAPDCNVALLANVKVALPSALALPTLNMPALSCVPPEYVFAALSTTVPAPALVNLYAPLITPVRLRFTPLPALTVLAALIAIVPDSDPPVALLVIVPLKVMASSNTAA